MLDFLKGYNQNRSVFSSQIEIPVSDAIEPRKDVKQQLVEEFINNNAFQGENIVQFSVKCLSQFAKIKEISQGAFFITDEKDGRTVIKFLSGFASPEPDEMTDILELGEGFPGQVARDGKMLNISDIPEGYLTIESGLGKASPVSLILFPVKHEDKILGVIELSSFHRFTEDDENFFSQIAPSLAAQMLRCKNTY